MQYMYNVKDEKGEKGIKKKRKRKQMKRKEEWIAKKRK